MSKVIIEKGRYDYDILKPLLFEMLDNLGGEKISKGDSVVIKPNLLAPAAPDRAIVTHPLVIRAVVEYVNIRGVRPQISDSPAVSSFKKILSESKIGRELRGLDVDFKEFTTSVKVDVGKPFNEIEIARDAVECDYLINLPKLKTHAQMQLTLGVKNLFGCIVGMKKPEWHFRTGVDREMFADLLARIHNALKPGITIVDGILAMDGQGPGKSGTPRELGLILGSDSAVAVDVTICRMLGIEPGDLLTNKMSGSLDDEITIDGKMPLISNFRIPDIIPLTFGPRGFHRFTRKHLVQRPLCNKNVCKLCGECWKYCPAGAISHDKKRIYFNYDSCIRCYCCIEVCPHGALEAKETLLGGAARKILGIR